MTKWETSTNGQRIGGICVAIILFCFFMGFIMMTSIELDDHVDCENGDEESCGHHPISEWSEPTIRIIQENKGYIS